MSANNVVLEHASLWVQIWGVSFEMMSPMVVTKIGKKMGVVEDVERRRRIDDQNFFLRVRVALPISKPLRRGGFLMGSDGKRHWVERLPTFCHYCGILGHDIRHYPSHFEALKKTTSVAYQYGDWLRAVNGRNKSPPRRRFAYLSRDAPLGKEDNPVEENTRVLTVEPAVARALMLNDSNFAHYGKGGLYGIVSKIQAQITAGIYSKDSLVTSHVPVLAPCGDLVLNLNEDSTNRPKTNKNELG